MPYSILLRVVLPLLLGYWVARRLRHFIMSLVLRLMPLKMRLSQKAFALQARITMIIGIVIIAAAVIIVNYAYIKLLPLAGQSADTVRQEVVPAPKPETPLPVPPQPSKPEKTPFQKKEQPSPQVNPIAPAPYTSGPRRKMPVEAPVYLQLGAFRNHNLAWAARSHYEKQFQRPVWVGQNPNDYASYKVLVGPFRNRSAAKGFKKANRLNAFARTLDEIYLYQS